VRGICAKRKDHPDQGRVQCGTCAHSRFLPVTDEVIRWHLSGEDREKKPFVAGVYALLPDETCWFLAMDFYEDAWQEDAIACRDTCRSLGLPVAFEPQVPILRARPHGSTRGSARAAKRTPGVTI
jgi:hypothetical protein